MAATAASRLGLAAAGDVDGGAFLGEGLGGGQADACCAAGDDCDLACKLLGHEISP